MRIDLGSGLEGPDIRPGLDNRHLIMRSWKVKEGQRWSFPDTRLTFQVRKVIAGSGPGGL